MASPHERYCNASLRPRSTHWPVCMHLSTHVPRRGHCSIACRCTHPNRSPYGVRFTVWRQTRIIRYRCRFLQSARPGSWLCSHRGVSARTDMPISDLVWRSNSPVLPCGMHLGLFCNGWNDGLYSHSSLSPQANYHHGLMIRTELPALRIAPIGLTIAGFLLTRM